MISLELALKHMAWANQGIYAELLQLPNDALLAYVTNSEWTVGEIASHIAEASDWYGYRLSGRVHTDFARPTTMAQMKEIADLLATFDADLLEQSLRPDAEIIVLRDAQEFRCMRSTILTQGIHHATEHRAQLVGALEYKGLTSINLDDFDLWGYESFIRARGE